MSNDEKYLLVLGIGNLLLTDEGLGVHAVKTLLQEEWPAGVEFADGGTWTQDMVFWIKDYKQLLVLDVVKAGREPGTMYRFTEDDLRSDESQRLSLHDIDLLDSLNMAGMIGAKPELTVLGMEPKDFTTWTMEMTPTVQSAFPKYLEVVRKEIRAILDRKMQ
ncbi:MAG: hydrogenase maturation protease [Okeania sp. SIO3B3]|nr:hydrogenase maturation protease [Okeania sp. SIO3B3]